MTPEEVKAIFSLIDINRDDRFNYAEVSVHMWILDASFQSEIVICAGDETVICKSFHLFVVYSCQTPP